MIDTSEQLAGLIAGRGTIALTEEGPVRLVPCYTVPRRCGRTAAVLESARQLRAHGCEKIIVEVGPMGTRVIGVKRTHIMQVFHGELRLV